MLIHSRATKDSSWCRVSLVMHFAIDNDVTGKETSLSALGKHKLISDLYSSNLTDITGDLPAWENYDT